MENSKRFREAPDCSANEHRKALGRSRGGLTTKIHLLPNEMGVPLDFLITGGQGSDCTQAIALLGQHRPRPSLPIRDTMPMPSWNTSKRWEPKL